MSTNTENARQIYRAYETGDREQLEALVADDYVFFSPRDDGLDRATYFERCWPGHEQLDGFELVRMIENGDEVLVTYEATRSDGGRFRNTEVLTFGPDGRMTRTEVYFGWDLAS